MRGTLRLSGPAVNADLQPNPAPSCREEHAAAWRDALWRHGSALAALFDWRPDTVQSYARIQAENDSPSERLEKAIDGLLRLGVPYEEAIRPLAVTARRLGLGLCKAVPVAGMIVPNLVLSDVLERTSNLVRETTLAARDGEIDARERDSIEARCIQLEDALLALRQIGKKPTTGEPAP